MRLRFILTVICLLSIFSSCNKKSVVVSGLKMLEGGKTFAVPTGTIADQCVLKRFPDARIKYYNSVLDCAIAVKDGKADAACYDLPVLKNIAGKNEGVTVLSDLLMDDRYGFGVQQGNSELKGAIDSVLAKVKRDGTYAEMMNRWFPEKGNPGPMPELTLDGSGGVLKFGTAAVTEPMSYYDENRKIIGFDIEFATRVAQRLNKKLEIVDMEFGAMLPALISGKVDMIGAGLSITEERAKKILYSESYYPSGIAALVRVQAGNNVKVAAAGLNNLDDVKKSRIGVLLGSIHDMYANRDFPEAKILQYQNVPDIITALKTEKVDVAFADHIALKDIFDKNPDLDLFAGNLYTVPIAAAFNRENDALREQFNAFLKKIRSDGTYADMVSRWMEKGDSRMPDIVTTGENGTLKTGIVSDIGLPFTIRQGSSLAGFDIELSTRFAASLGKKFEPVDIPFGSMLASISTNKIDIVTCSLMITEERKKMVDFSDPYFESGVSLFALKTKIIRKKPVGMATLEDIADKRIGVFTGTVHDVLVTKKYPSARIFRYDSSTDMITALSGDKIDVAMLDQITARLIMKRNTSLGVLSDDVLTLPLGVGFNKNNPELRNEFNAFLKEIRSDGTYDKMFKRWFVDDAEEAVMPVFDHSTGGKKLMVGVNVNDLPYVAVMNNSYVGFDIEMIQTFAARKNYQVEFVTMLFPSLIPALAAGKVNMVSDGIAITEERGKQIDFSDSYADFRTSVLAAKKNLAAYSDSEVKTERKSFFRKVSDSFYSNILLEKR